MATEFNTGTDASLDEAVKSRYEANADTNAFTDAEQNKLAGIQAGAEINAVDSVNGATGAVVLDADQISDAVTANKFASASQLSKLDGIESGATADQTGTEIVQAIDAELGGTGWQSGGSGGGSTDFVSNVAQDRILGRISGGSGNSEELTAAQVRSFLNTLSAAELASAASGEGASRIGVEDAGGFTAAVTVEAALQEIYTTLGGHGDIVSENGVDFVRKTEREVIVFDAGGSSTAPRPAQPADKTVIWFNHGTGLPDNMGAFDIAAGQDHGQLNVNTQTGTAYTLIASDAGHSVDMDNAGANTVTIPDDATVAFDIGTCVSITQLGTGVTTIAASVGVTLNGSPANSVSINSQFSGAVLRKIAADVWIVQGDVS